jgi:outer membrane protein OmpA-like peptidoglycan-associated protein
MTARRGIGMHKGSLELLRKVTLCTVTAMALGAAPNMAWSQELAAAKPPPATTTTAPGETAPIQIDVGVFAGLTIFSSVSGLGNAALAADVPGNAPMVGLRAGVLLLGGKLGLEGEFRDAFTKLGGPSGDAQVYGLRAQGSWHFLTEGSFRPYAIFGAGQEILKAAKSTCPKAKTAPTKTAPTPGCIYVASPDTDNAFFVGAGARLPLSHRISLRGDLRWLAADIRPAEPGKPKRAWSEFAHNFEGQLGAVYSIGGRPEDQDKDGVPDELDRCIAQPEDRDGFQDQDGCPDVDNDDDGIEDNGDKCPNAAEDIDRFQDQDGCPDEDNDGDGIPDVSDKCPEQAEDKDGVDDADGCPDLDDDGDGIDNNKDKCPKQKEDKDGFEDADGCPDPDNDGDGIPDGSDKCPNQAESKNGIDDDDGCPDKVGEAVAKLFGGPVVFEWKGAVLQKASETQLEPLLELMLEHDSLKVEIAVTSDEASDPAKLLADKRALAIKSWLEENGIDRARLRASVTDGPTLATGAKPKKIDMKGVTKAPVTFRIFK